MQCMSPILGVESVSDSYYSHSKCTQRKEQYRIIVGAFVIDSKQKGFKGGGVKVGYKSGLKTMRRSVQRNKKGNRIMTIIYSNPKQDLYHKFPAPITNMQRHLPAQPQLELQNFDRTIKDAGSKNPPSLL